MSIIFGFIIFLWNFVVMLKKTPDLNLVQNKFSPFAIVLWTVFLRIIILNSLLRADLSTHWFDLICLSETYLDSDTSHEDANLEIVGYTLIRADHPSNTKRGGTCLYYRNSLAFRLSNIQYLEECINFEISFAGKVCNFISLYRMTILKHLLITSN